jgi:hypothetical protein
MIMYYFIEKVSFPTIAEANAYFTHCTKRLQNLCSETALETMKVDPSLVLATSGVFLTIKGVQDLYSSGLKSKKAWSEVAIGVLGMTAYPLSSTIQNLFYKCPFTQLDSTYAEHNIKRYLSPRAGTVQCNQGTWDVEEQTYLQICQTNSSFHNDRSFNLYYYPVRDEIALQGKALVYYVENNPE